MLVTVIPVIMIVIVIVVVGPLALCQAGYFEAAVAA